MSDRIELSVRAFAEMLVLPGYEQERILHEQKYPKQGPARFRVPYYRPALSAIRSYYRQDNDDGVLRTALHELGLVVGSAETKARQNTEVIQRFRRGLMARRSLRPVPGQIARAELNGVVLRASPDLVCCEGSGDDLLALYLNFRTGEVDLETAKYTIELSRWVFEQGSPDDGPRHTEYVDVRANKKYRQAAIRARTLSRAGATARLVTAAWPGL